MPEHSEALRFAAKRNALGLANKELGKFDEARAEYDRALAAIEASFEPQLQAQATLLHNLGGIEYARGRFSDAESFARRGLTIRRGDSASMPGEIAADMNALATILEALDRSAEAEAMYAESLATLKRSPGDNAAEVAVAFNGLATLAARRGRLDLSTVLLERSLELRRRALGTRHRDLAIPLNNLGVVYRRRGMPREAEAHYLEALDILADAVPADHPRIVAIRWNLMRCRGRAT